jgi:hypothetical protein
MSCFWWLILVSIFGYAWVVNNTFSNLFINKGPCASSWCRSRVTTPFRKKSLTLQQLSRCLCSLVLYIPSGATQGPTPQRCKVKFCFKILLNKLCEWFLALSISLDITVLLVFNEVVPNLELSQFDWFLLIPLIFRFSYLISKHTWGWFRNSYLYKYMGGQGGMRRLLSEEH